MKSLRNFFSSQPSYSQQNQEYLNFRQLAFSPVISGDIELTQMEVEEKARQIFQWAKKKGALYYSFLAYPLAGGILEKQETFLDLNYSFKQTLKTDGRSIFSFQQLGKGEGDGSSFPSGGLRVTHQARAYTVWDTKSEVFIRPKSKVLYIPSLLVTHNGEALDDKTLFRKSQKILQDKTLQLLKKLKINASAVVMALGLQQQFFVVKKEVANTRIDIRSTGRTLIGKLPPKNQQFSDHYYGKIPIKIEKILQQVEQQLLAIGVPCKTRHQEVAPNQFEFVPLFEEAGKTIDHNMILIEVMKQKFQEKGLSVLFHEKPFQNVNGSGKHCNWSLNYVDQFGNLNNLFAVPKNAKNKKLFQLIVLIQLKALLKHSKLYLTSVSCCGNQLRLGGHEAPPRIISTFLGSAVSKILDNEELDERKNLEDEVPGINFQLLQEDTDRNRTSPYAYSGNKFEFRAVGSSQNVSFPMAVIAATIAKQMDGVLQDLSKGKKIEEIINVLRQQTRNIRFEGNGYSKEWVQEAKKRGLYVNQNFVENILNFKEAGKVFEEIGVCKENDLAAKYAYLQEIYSKTTMNEVNSLRSMLNSQIVPQAYEYLRLVEPQSKSDKVNMRSQKFLEAFNNVLEVEENLEKIEISENILQMGKIRAKLFESCEVINKLLEKLPKNKKWMQFQDFINDY